MLTRVRTLTNHTVNYTSISRLQRSRVRNNLTPDYALALVRDYMTADYCV